MRKVINILSLLLLSVPVCAKEIVKGGKRDWSTNICVRNSRWARNRKVKIPGTRFYPKNEAEAKEIGGKVNQAFDGFVPIGSGEGVWLTGHARGKYAPKGGFKTIIVEQAGVTEEIKLPEPIKLGRTARLDFLESIYNRDAVGGIIQETKTKEGRWIRKGWIDIHRIYDVIEIRTKEGKWKRKTFPMFPESEFVKIKERKPRPRIKGGMRPWSTNILVLNYDFKSRPKKVKIPGTRFYPKNEAEARKIGGKVNQAFDGFVHIGSNEGVWLTGHARGKYGFDMIIIKEESPWRVTKRIKLPKLIKLGRTEQIAFTVKRHDIPGYQEGLVQSTMTKEGWKKTVQGWARDIDPKKHKLPEPKIEWE